MTTLKIIFLVFTFILGSVFASFAGVIAYRVPKGKSILKPGSYCPACNNHLKWYDNIPILSWIILGGKCRNCKAKIGIFSLLMEIFGGLGFASAYFMYGDDLKKLPIMIVLMLLVFLFMIIANIDYETHYIYSITLVIFAVFALFITLYKVFMFEVNIWPYIIGAAFGFGFFLLIKVLAKLAMKKDALGSGDIYLVGIAGFLLGIFPLLLAILIATLLGSIIEVTKIKLKKQSRESEIAFGPYLLLGIGILAIYGDAIMDLYWKVMS